MVATKSYNLGINQKQDVAGGLTINGYGSATAALNDASALSVKI